MSAIRNCRTAALGGHLEGCEDCGHLRIAYDSCRNRHCPKCQGRAARQWLAAREADLLPVGYFHVVFTVPAGVADIAFQNKTAVYDLLFQAASETMVAIAADPRHLGVRIGITAVLHSWGSAMTHHPHIHMIVPGGGLSLDGDRWVSSGARFLLPVRVLAKLFRRLFLDKLRQLQAAGRLQFFADHAGLSDPRAFLRHLAPLRKKKWVVYAKPPFAGPEAVLAYLSRYTHRVAISNRRLISFNDTGVTFRYKEPAPAEPEEPAPPPDPRPPCPWCGGRMVVIEIFQRAAQARAAGFAALIRDEEEGVVTRRDEHRSTVEAVPLRPSRGRTPRPTASSTPMPMSARSAGPPPRHRLASALTDHPSCPAPAASGRLPSLRDLRPSTEFLKSP